MMELLLEAERAISLGMLDQAERLYRQAADADPRNAIAVVGLAKVAIERGDEEDALALGERALGIDPENLAARRLVERLREVRAYRAGQPLPPREDMGIAPVAVGPGRAPDRPASARPGPEPARAPATTTRPAPADDEATAPEPATAREPATAPEREPPARRGLLGRLFGRRGR